MDLLTRATSMTSHEIAELLATNAHLQQSHALLTEQVCDLQRQLEWLHSQLFGKRSERRLLENPDQLSLGQSFESIPTDPIPTKTIPAHERRKLSNKQKLEGCVTSQGLRFGPNVPVKEIRLTIEGLQDKNPQDYVLIEEKITHKLAQEPGSFVILKYIQPVVKLKDTKTLVSAPMPVSVLEKSYFDVSVLVGMLLDKFLYHSPLYRQHQKMKHQGILLSRSAMSQSVERAIALLAPIATAQYRSVLDSAIIIMDETPTKAGCDKARHQMKTGYFWPMLGDADEVVFTFFNNRRHENVEKLLKDYRGILLSDGYGAYEAYARKVNLPTPDDPKIIHAQCWVHWRRMFLKAQDLESERVNRVLDFIGALYQHEQQMRDTQLDPPQRLAYRQQHSAPIVAELFRYLEQQQQDRALLPADDFTKAVSYGFKCRDALEVFLIDPQVPLDTNAIERTLRVIPMGRKNWLFSWTEAGAKQIGIIQSLLATCTLQGINHYDYLVDVLQRVAIHPASKVHELTPRYWKTVFKNNPLRSVLHKDYDKGKNVR